MKKIKLPQELYSFKIPKTKLQKEHNNLVELIINEQKCSMFLKEQLQSERVGKKELYNQAELEAERANKAEASVKRLEYKISEFEDVTRKLKNDVSELSDMSLKRLAIVEAERNILRNVIINLLKKPE